MQEEDAARRMQILRGETPTPILEVEGKGDDRPRDGQAHGPRRERKIRKRAGENETEFEMRIAQEQTSNNSERQMVLRKPIDAPLVDDSGHIDLFPQEPQKKKSVEKNAEAEKEAAKKKKEYEDQYTMRFSNAAGFKQGLERPWYSTPSSAVPDKKALGKDVWGNEDPRRKAREAARVVSSDPLAMMRQGAAKVREVEKERKRWREEKEYELRQLKAEERRAKRKRRDEDPEEDDLENFRLDDTESSSRRKDSESRHRHKRSRESRRDDEGSRHKHRHRHRESRRD